VINDCFSPFSLPAVFSHLQSPPFDYIYNRGVGCVEFSCA